MSTIADDRITLPPPPRRLRRCRGYLQLVQNHVMLVFLLMFASIFWTTGVGLIKLYFDSVRIPGQVTRAWTTASAHGPTYDIAVAYQFDGVAYEQTLNVTAQEADTYKVGAAVPLQLLAEWPNRPLLYRESYPHRFVTLMGCLMALGACGSVVGMLWKLYVAPWRLRELLRHGRLATGVITNRQERPGRPNTCTLTYEFNPTDGDATLRRTMQVCYQDFQKSCLGDQVVVVHDPHKPHRCVLLDYADYEIVGATPRSAAHDSPALPRLTIGQWASIAVTSSIMVAVLLWLFGWLR
jgi:hypothetical protein